MLHQEAYRGKDLAFTAGRIKELYSEYGVQEARIDVVGIGAGVVDMLKDEARMTVVPVNVGAASTEPDKYADLSTEMWAKAGRLFKDGEVMLQDDAVLKAQLVSRRFGYVHKGGGIVMKLESKQDMRRKGQHSPDRADALIMALVMPVKSGLGDMADLALSSVRIETFDEY